MIPLLHEVMQRVPGLELTIHHGKAKRLNEWLLASEIDVVLTAEGDSLTERANRWPVFSDPIVVLMPDGHTLAAQEGLAVGSVSV